ncbi:DUF4328 domain-containing protein [Streptosporangium sp. NPDC000396]|uniref:DUF4328 domain-containing protein n=1 Tax=Streptosporangium sp. NPDC000396 TaxID=3366185 RepID=UPI00367D2F56
MIATTALVIFEQVRGRRLAREISALGGDPHSPGAQAVVGAVTVFAVLIMFVAAATIAAAAAYLTWLIRAWRNVSPFASPTSAVLAGWFVPVVNLVVPPVLTHRLWQASHPPADRHGRWPALLGAWWLSWLAVLALIPVRLPLDTAPGNADLTGLGPVELAAIAISALLCAATVREITEIQAAGSRRLARFPAGQTTPEIVSQVLAGPIPSQQARSAER